MKNLTDKQLAFLEKNRSAAMITPADDGIPRAVRVSIALLDGKLRSSGTQDRMRTARLRANPICTLFVFDASGNYLTLETRVHLIESDDVPELTVQMFRKMQNRPVGNLNWMGQEMTEEALKQSLVEGRRLIYEFDVTRAYGMV
jgi:hypothetical protein